jgi:hypothetical protein
MMQLSSLPHENTPDMGAAREEIRFVEIWI